MLRFKNILSAVLVFSVFIFSTASTSARTAQAGEFHQIVLPTLFSANLGSLAMAIPVAAAAFLYFMERKENSEAGTEEED